jgi:uncharacterized protein (TIGR03435 family)
MQSSILEIVSRSQSTSWPLCLGFVLSSVVLAQPSFDVASVKQHAANDHSFSPPTCTNNRFRSAGSPILEVLAWAYDLRFDQFLALEASLPPWARTGAFDIEAVANEQMTASQCRQAVQGLFLDRFKLKSHWKKVVNAPGYVISVAANGHRLKPVSSTDTGCGVHISWEGKERPCDRYQWPLATKRGMSTTELARVLSLYVGRYPVRDLTGLTGEYKIDLSFTTHSDNLQYPTLEQALQSQLGLVIRSSKIDAEYLIADSIELPDAN